MKRSTGFVLCCVLFGFFMYVGNEHSSSRPSSPPPPPTEAQKAAQKERDTKRGMVALGALTIKKQMRDPDSFVLEQALLMDDGSACYTYRSKNGFGGMSRDFAAQAPGGASVQIGGMKGFEALWKKYCQGKKGEDMVEVINDRVLCKTCKPPV